MKHFTVVLLEFLKETLREAYTIVDLIVFVTLLTSLKSSILFLITWIVWFLCCKPFSTKAYHKVSTKIINLKLPD